MASLGLNNCGSVTTFLAAHRQLQWMATCPNFWQCILGSPQGSVLGPLLFLIFINDLPDCLACMACNIYADDTEIHCCAYTTTEVETTLQKDLCNINKWFHDNRLIPNGSKSYSLLTTSNRSRMHDELNLTIGDAPIAQVNCTKYLGIHPDSMLSWSNQVTLLCHKLAPKVGLLRRLKQIVPSDCLKKIYQSTVQSHIDYCLPVWGFTSDVHIDRVQRLQNRAARIILGNYSGDIRGIDLVRELGWMNVRQRRDYFTLVLVYKALHGLAPAYVNDLFTFSRDIQTYSTRSTCTSQLHIPRVRKQVFKQSLQFNGPRLWNTLPEMVRSSCSLSVFKHKCKSFILSWGTWILSYKYYYCYCMFCLVSAICLLHAPI